MDLGYLFFEVIRSVFDGLELIKMAVESASQFQEHCDSLLEAINEWFWGGLEFEFEKPNLNFEGLLTKRVNLKFFLNESILNITESDTIMGRYFLLKDNSSNSGTNEVINA